MNLSTNLTHIYNLNSWSWGQTRPYFGPYVMAQPEPKSGLLRFTKYILNSILDPFNLGTPVKDIVI